MKRSDWVEGDPNTHGPLRTLIFLFHFSIFFSLLLQNYVLSPPSPRTLMNFPVNFQISTRWHPAKGGGATASDIKMSFSFGFSLSLSLIFPILNLKIPTKVYDNLNLRSLKWQLPLYFFVLIWGFGYGLVGINRLDSFFWLWICGWFIVTADCDCLWCVCDSLWLRCDLVLMIRVRLCVCDENVGKMCLWCFCYSNNGFGFGFENWLYVTGGLGFFRVWKWDSTFSLQVCVCCFWFFCRFLRMIFFCRFSDVF